MFIVLGVELFPHILKQKVKIIFFFVTFSLLTVFNFDFGSKTHGDGHTTQAIEDSTSIVLNAVDGYQSGENSKSGESFQNRKSVMAYNLVFYIFYEFLNYNPVKGG